MLLVLMGASLATHSQEEFNGPYAGWANVVTRFKAAGNGIRDDTKALQQALHELANPVVNAKLPAGSYMVIYLPKGTYNISATLQLRGKIGVMIIGEDPANTIIKWTGGDNDTMLWANGSAYFKVSRLTFDANNKKGIEGIGIHWKEKWKDASGQSFASLNNEISDIIFKGTAIGVGGGTSSEGTNNNDSEITIRRCTFIKCSVAAIKIHGYNALNYWIWHCRFLECHTGIDCTSGNYHVYNSYFKGSTFTDIQNSNGYYSSVRNCYSSGANVVSWDLGRSCNPFKRVFQGNTIRQPFGYAIGYHHLGSVTMMDNRIDKSTGKEYVQHVNMGSWCPGDYTTLSIGNTYGSPKPLVINTSSHTIYNYRDSAGSTTMAGETAFINALPPTPPKVARKIFEVPANSTAKYIQQVIQQAAALKGTKPVIHFAAGRFVLDQTLIIPEESDMQLTGDGLLYASALVMRPGISGKPVLLVKGPSYISIQHLQLGEVTGGKNLSSVLAFENVDQPGAKVFIDQLYAASDTALHIDRLNYLYVEKNNSFFSSGNHVSGGTLQVAGKGTLQVNCFGGQFAGLSLQNNATFVAKDCWWEGAKGKAIDLSGSGTVTIDGAMVAPVGADSSTVIRVGNFKGKVSLLNMYVQGALEVVPKNDLLEVMTWNVHFYFKTNPLAFVKSQATYRGLFFGITAQCFNVPGVTCTNLNPVTVAEKMINISKRDDFTIKMAGATRSAIPRQWAAPKKGISNVFISRVTVGVAAKGITFINR